MDKKEILTPLEIDMLGEMLNIGIASAAVSLSKIIKQEVKLTVPEIEFLSADEMANRLGAGKLVSSVSRHVIGPFDAQSMLLFPKESSYEVVRKMLGNEVSLDLIDDVHQEAFIEVGNLMIEACIEAISSVLNVNFDISPAAYELSSPHKILPVSNGKEQTVVLDAGIKITLSETPETGALVFLLGPIHVDGLKKSVGYIVRKLTNQSNQ